MIKYIFISITLFFLELLYIKIAKAKNIKDNPNHRSAHTTPTVRGGGIIVVIAVVLYSIIYKAESPFYYFFSAMLIVSIVSFIDDLVTLSSKVRITIHLIAFAILFIGLNIIDFSSLNAILLLIGLSIFALGFLNIYNFMDGINGITFLNATISYSALLYLNIYYVAFTDSNLLVTLLLAVLVFGFFNFRKNAICFAGDIGSISIGFSLIYFVLKLYLESHNPLVFLIFSVYLLDGGWTIIERLFRKENIFQAHKRHLYQLLANDLKIKHLTISGGYFFIQVVFVMVLIYAIENKFNTKIALILAILIASVIYMYIKYKVIQKVSQLK